MDNGNLIKPFFFPFKESNKRAMIIWVTTAILLVLFIYEGSELFYVKHFDTDYQKGTNPILSFSTYQTYHILNPNPENDWYKYIYKHICTFLLLAIIPICIVKFWLKEPLKDIGIAIGDWRFGIKATLVSMIIMLPMMLISSKNPEFRAFYPLTTLANVSWGYFALWGLTYLPHYIGWEVMFRGYLGMGLKKEAGVFQAMMIQVVITTLLHIGKPEGETWSTIPAGIYMGLLTYRTGSIIWPVLFHFYVGMMNTWFAGL